MSFFANDPTVPLATRSAFGWPNVDVWLFPLAYQVLLRHDAFIHSIRTYFFGGVMLNGPPLWLTDQQYPLRYGSHDCVSGTFFHRAERAMYDFIRQQNSFMDCCSLLPYMSFVYRKLIAPNKILEVVQIGDTVLWADIIPRE
eukprot:g21934.t1